MPTPTRPTEIVRPYFSPLEGVTFPITVDNRPGEVVIHLAPRAELDPILIDGSAYLWIKGVPGRVVVDLSRIRTINATLCGWLENLIHTARPATVMIKCANDQITEALVGLGMDVVMIIGKAGQGGQAIPGGNAAVPTAPSPRNGR